MRSGKFYIVIYTIICFFLLAGNAYANQTTEIQQIIFDKETIEKGFTLQTADGNFMLGITPDLLTAPSSVVLKTLIHDDSIVHFESITIKDLIVYHPIPEDKILTIYTESKMRLKEAIKFYKKERPVIIK